MNKTREIKLLEYLSSLLSKHNLDNTVEEAEKSQATIDYNVMMGNIESPFDEDAEEVNEDE